MYIHNYISFPYEPPRDNFINPAMVSSFLCYTYGKLVAPGATRLTYPPSASPRLIYRFQVLQFARGAAGSVAAGPLLC